MKTLVKTKLLDLNHIEAREYELFKDKIKLLLCESPNYRMCRHEGEKFMILSVAEQRRKGKVVNTLQSKFPPYSYYRMYKFPWKPQAQQYDMFRTNPSVWERLRENKELMAKLGKNV